MEGEGSVQMVSEWAPVIDTEMCLLMKAGTKLSFDEVMPETDKLKKNKMEEATISLHSSWHAIYKVERKMKK